MDNYIKKVDGKKIEIKFINKEIELSKEEKEKIDKYWIKDCQVFFRGKIFVIDNIIENNEYINIDIKYSDFAHYIYSRRFPGEVKNCYNVWAGILLETIDNKYVLGEMSNITSSEGEYHISGGACDERELKDNHLDYETTMYRELKEEMNIDKMSLEDVQMKYLKVPYYIEEDFGIIYKAKVKMTSNQLEEHYSKYLAKLMETRGEIEYNKLVFVDKDKNKIEEFCKQNKTPDYTKELIIQDVSEK